MAVCVKCQTKLDPGARFCKGCGFTVVFADARIETVDADMDVPPLGTRDQNEKPLAPDEKICPSCGAAIKKAAEICRTCGVLQVSQAVPRKSGGLSGLAIAAIVAAGVLVLAAAVFVALRLLPPEPVAEVETDFIVDARRAADENALLGMGASNFPDRDTARTAAETRARIQIVRQIEAVIRSMVLDYAAGSGTSLATIVEWQDGIVLALADLPLYGAVILDEFADGGGEHIVAVMLSRENVAATIAAVVTAMAESGYAQGLAPSEAFQAAMKDTARLDRALAEQSRQTPEISFD